MNLRARALAAHTRFVRATGRPPSVTELSRMTGIAPGSISQTIRALALPMGIERIMVTRKRTPKAGTGGRHAPSGYKPSPMREVANSGGAGDHLIACPHCGEAWSRGGFMIGDVRTCWNKCGGTFRQPPRGAPAAADTGARP